MKIISIVSNFYLQSLKISSICYTHSNKLDYFIIYIPFSAKTSTTSNIFYFTNGKSQVLSNKGIVIGLKYRC